MTFTEAVYGPSISSMVALNEAQKHTQQPAKNELLASFERLTRILYVADALLQRKPEGGNFRVVFGAGANMCVEDFYTNGRLFTQGLATESILFKQLVTVGCRDEAVMVFQNSQSDSERRWSLIKFDCEQFPLG